MTYDLEPTPECYCDDKHLVFDTEAEAIAAEKQISLDMGFTGAVTARWDVPRQCADGRWIIARPNLPRPKNQNHGEGVDPDWWPQIDPDDLNPSF